jgi:Mannose-6-phosphate isomerase
MRNKALLFFAPRTPNGLRISGSAEVTLGSDVRSVHENESIYITIGSVHRLANPGKFQPLRRQLLGEEVDTCQVAARPGEAGDQACPDRVFGDGEDDGDRRDRRLGRQRRRFTGRDDDRDLSANQ